jgi:hypothetical protein
LVDVDIPGGESIPIDELGDASSVAKRSVGKLNVVDFLETGKVFVRQQVAKVVGEVFGEIHNAVLPFL